MGILTRAEDSALLAMLLAALPQIRDRLTDVGAWNGMRVREPDLDEEYLRVSSRDDLVTSGDAPRAYRPAVHLFTRAGYEGRLHDHRWPIAVLPFDLDGARGAALYEMPWEVRREGAVVERGRMVVRSGEPWSIEACSEVFHGVKSLRPHLSLVMADVTDPPRRENRMQLGEMTSEEVAQLLSRARGLVPASRR